MVEIELNGEQIKAVRSLERAFSKCSKAKIYIHNCYGVLIAYDGNVVHCVNDEESPITCDAGTSIATPRDIELASWADDAHYVHLHD